MADGEDTRKLKNKRHCSSELVGTLRRKWHTSPWGIYHDVINGACEIHCVNIANFLLYCEGDPFVKQQASEFSFQSGNYFSAYLRH